MYEIRQQVVCVKTHSMGAVKEGDIKQIKSIMIGCCGDLVLDVGVSNRRVSDIPLGAACWCCNSKHTLIEDGIWWISATLFRPLDDLYNTEIEELMNEVNEKQPFEV